MKKNIADREVSYALKKKNLLCIFFNDEEKSGWVGNRHGEWE